MDRTPVHDIHNADLLRLDPESASRLIEVRGRSSALARGFKKINAACRYYGIDIVPDYIDLPRRHRDDAIAVNIETAEVSFFTAHRDGDCWRLADTLEHLADFAHPARNPQCHSETWQYRRLHPGHPALAGDPTTSNRRFQHRYLPGQLNTAWL